MVSPNKNAFRSHLNCLNSVSGCRSEVGKLLQTIGHVTATLRRQLLRWRRCCCCRVEISTGDEQHRPVLAAFDSSLTFAATQVIHSNHHHHKAMVHCTLCPGTPCTRDSASLGTHSHLGQDETSTMQQGFQPDTTMQRDCCGNDVIQKTRQWVRSTSAKSIG